jgi:hypothetical protein
VIVGLFVDDMLLINYSTDPNALDNLINKELSTHFKIKYSPDLDKFLGAEFNIIEDGIYMHLTSYIQSDVDRFDEQDSSGAPTPALATMPLPTALPVLPMKLCCCEVTNRLNSLLLGPLCSV